MTALSIFMALTWFAAGIALLWMGVEAERTNLPRNNWFGIRTRKLLASDDAWVRGHKAAAHYLKLSSVPPFIGGVVCLVADDVTSVWVSLPVTVIFLVMVFLATKKAQSSLKG